MSFKIGNNIMIVTPKNKNLLWGQIVGLESKDLPGNVEGTLQHTIFYKIVPSEVYGRKDNYIVNKIKHLPQFVNINTKTNNLQYYTKPGFDELKEAAKKKHQDLLQERDEEQMEQLRNSSNSPVVFPMDNFKRFPMDNFKRGGRKKKRKKTKRRGRRTRNKKKNQRKTKKLNNGKYDRCAPKPEGDRLPYSCYTKESLHKIKNVWNNRHPDKQILSNDPKEIWKDLKHRLNKTCKRESCWLKHKCIKENVDKEVIKYTFRPKRPKSWKSNSDEWLNSNDITKFMKQYEHRHKDFSFLGPSPINYDSKLMSDECVWEELCKFNLKNEIRRKKTKIGIVFNLDPHYKSGSHWVALFINTNNKCIYYFDSYGDKTPKGIKKLVKTIKNQSSNIGLEYKFKENKKRHQYSNSECGMFCLHFIRSMILHDNWRELTTKKLNDKEMLRLRKVYYNP
jgi:hypothetical protein